MRNMKRWLSFLLVAVMLFTTGIWVLPAHAAEGETEVRWGQIGGGAAIAILNGNTAGVRFAAENRFVAVTFAVNCKVEYTVRVFSWNQNYATTTAGEPVSAVKHTVTKAGLQTVSLGEVLPAGEYYVEYTAEGAYDSTDQTGRADLWTHTPDSRVECYYNGAVTTAADRTVAGGIVYADSTVTTLGTISHPYTALWGQIGGGSAIAVLNGNAAGVRFAAKNRFQAFTFGANTSVEYTVKLYRWVIDYQSTVSQAPVYATTVTVTKAGAQSVTLDKAYDAGEYYVEYSAEGAYDASTQDGRADLWTYTTSNKAEYYYNGTLTTDPSQTVAGGIVYVDNTVTALGAVSHPHTALWGQIGGGGGELTLHDGTVAASAGTRFIAKNDVSAVVFGTGSTNAYTVRIFEWNTDYATTTGVAPILEKTLTAVYGKNYVLLDTALPKGEYYVEYTAAEDFHVWWWDSTDNRVAEHYYNGEVTADKTQMMAGGVVYVDDSVTGLDTVNASIVYRAVQTSLDMQTAETFDIRFIATIDSLAYRSVGFDVIELIHQREWSSNTQTVYTSLNTTVSTGGTELATKEVTAEELGGKYIVAAIVTDVPADTELRFAVNPYVVNARGEKEYGKSWEVHVTAEGVVTNVMPGEVQIYSLAPENQSLMQSFVIRTQNGKLIVIDGGIDGAGLNADAYMPAALRAIAGVGEDDYVEVEAWILSHAHKDHFHELTKTLNACRDDANFEIKQFIFDFPAYDTAAYPYAHSDAAYLNELKAALSAWAEARNIPVAEGSTFYDDLNGAYVNAETVANGQWLTVDNAKIEFLQTWDVSDGTDINSNSLVLRLWAGGQSVLFLQDAAIKAGNRLVGTYGDSLKSDIVQMAHHGQAGVNEACYQKIDADVRIWPTPLWVWNNTTDYQIGATRQWVNGGVDFTTASKWDIVTCLYPAYPASPTDVEAWKDVIDGMKITVPYAYVDISDSTEP